MGPTEVLPASCCQWQTNPLHLPWQEMARRSISLNKCVTAIFPRRNLAFLKTHMITITPHTSTLLFFVLQNGFVAWNVGRFSTDSIVLPMAPHPRCSLDNHLFICENHDATPRESSPFSKVNRVSGLGPGFVFWSNKCRCSLKKGELPAPNNFHVSYSVSIPSFNMNGCEWALKMQSDIY